MGGTTFEVADSPTWEGFRTMNFSTASYQVGPRSWTNPTASTYSFNDTNAWIIASDYYSGGMVMKYWPWSKASGWGAPVPLLATVTSNVLDAGQLLQLSRTNWLLYYMDVTAVQIKYVQTTDAGQTWTGPYTCTELTTTSSQCNRISFARYGDNYYIFLTDSNGNPTIYNSTDGINWANKQVVLSISGLVYHGTLLHQSALISTMSDVGTGDPGLQYGIITVVPEMLSSPSTSSNPYPVDGIVLPQGTSTTTLEVTVHGGQTYNVAFYWANGTFIGEDRILKEGDAARVQVATAPGGAYGWCAITRGTTFEYCGNEPQTTSDEKRTSTYTFTVSGNEAPIIDSYSPLTSTPNINTGESLSFSQTSHDPDGDPLGYEWFLDSVVKATTQDWTYVTDYGSAGIHNVTFAVSDGSLAATHEWSVTVVLVEPPTPGINFDPENITCRKYNEAFVLQINISDAVYVEDFEFEIHYNTTLLNYTSVSWNAWGSGTITVTEDSGIISGSTLGDRKTGSFVLVTIIFEAAYHHIWKSEPGWTNDLIAPIYFEWANISYPGLPDYGYVRGGLNQINVGPDMSYKFSPIQGDVNNDGTVDITDLRTVAAYYNAKEGDANWADASAYDLNGDKFIDIFDLVTITANYGFIYA
jgi:hypothetical protein